MVKYSDLISFHPIEDVIQLVTAENEDKAREYIKTYVISDHMAESLQAPVLDQLQMEEVVDNKGVLIVGNYGTGKSHCRQVRSSAYRNRRCCNAVVLSRCLMHRITPPVRIRLLRNSSRRMARLMTRQRTIIIVSRLRQM